MGIQQAKIMKKDRDAMRLYHSVSEEKHALRKLKEPH
jgi:hypothetical protein